MRAALGCALAACFVACAREPASSPARPVAFPPPPVLTSAPLAAPSALPSTPVAEPQATEGYAGAEDEPVDDGEPLDDVPPPLSAPPKPHPLEGWSEADIEKQLREDASVLGSMSVGRPGAGALINGVQLPESDAWQRVDAAHEWGTQETVDYLTEAIGVVRKQFPDSHPLFVGHISARHGGHLSPHISHQSGRDVDISFYYDDPDSTHWYARATTKNLDRARTWAFVRALITHTDVQLILADYSVQNMLKEYALGIGEDPAWVEGLFKGVPGKFRPLIVYAKGHATHLHIRFFNPIAQETARRAHRALLALDRIKPPVYYITHKVKKGETLGMLARKYGVSVREIQQANHLKNTVIVAKHEYKIPRKGGVSAPPRVVVPPRRLPPHPPRPKSESAKN